MGGVGYWSRKFITYSEESILGGEIILKITSFYFSISYDLKYWCLKGRYSLVYKARFSTIKYLITDI